jgi:hypothetical protein
VHGVGRAFFAGDDDALGAIIDLVDEAIPSGDRIKMEKALHVVMKIFEEGGIIDEDDSDTCDGGRAP